MSKSTALTTVDNPYNPFTNFDEWMQFDEEKGYYSCGLLARFTHSSSSFSESDQQRDLDDAKARILKLFPLLYRLISEDGEYIPAYSDPGGAS